MFQQCQNQGAKMLRDVVKQIDYECDKKVVTTNNFVLVCKAIIIASGANAKYLNLANEEKYLNNGLSACAVCDGSLPCYRKQDLIVVGGGDSAAEEAIYLSKFANSVTVVVRGDNLRRMSKVLQTRLLENQKIQVLFQTEVVEYIGENHIEGVTLLNKATNERSKKQVAGVFMAIGHTPNTNFCRGTFLLDEEGYIVSYNLNVALSNGHEMAKGVFAAGDVHDKQYRQAITACGFGCQAATECIRYFQTN